MNLSSLPLITIFIMITKEGTEEKVKIDLERSEIIKSESALVRKKDVSQIRTGPFRPEVNYV